MSDDKHKFSGWWNHGTVIKARGWLPAQATSEEFAKRIVACVNACAGLETGDLENIVMTGDTLQKRFNLLLNENTELTKNLLKYGLHKLSCDYVENHEGGIFGKSTGVCDCGFAEAIASVGRDSNPNCDYSACGDFGDSPCDNPDCNARKGGV